MLRFVAAIIVTLFTTANALTPTMRASASQASAPPDSRAVFVRVYPADAPSLIKPVTVRLGRMAPDQDLKEIAATIELEITIGLDGRVRDVMIKKSSGGERVEADAVRAAFNSIFQPGTLAGKPVVVRMPLDLTVPSR